MSTSLFGFIGYEFKPPGQISMPLSLDEELLLRTHTTIFIVVEVTLVYNVIFRKTNNELIQSDGLTLPLKSQIPSGQSSWRGQRGPIYSEKMFYRDGFR